jgi:Asp-tRNA(Asn)/Glu-tRNA(Gln) amidotransferase A subunit family amidase
MPVPPDRRRFLACFAGMGLGGTLLPGVLWARLQAGAEIDVETIRCAEEIAGLTFSEDERRLMLDDLQAQMESYRVLRRVPLDNSVPPAIRFDPSPDAAGQAVDPLGPGPAAPRNREVITPASADELAMLTIAELAELLRTRRVGSEELTRLYLRRIERLDPLLLSVVTVTAERALEQARAADAAIAAGLYRGSLHGIPWGAKDLLAVSGYPTTWGTPPFREQRLDTDATVVTRMDSAGAVLIAKLALGELAWGDVWFGGRTRNPWNLDQGASGSSAGPAAATGAGLVGFSIGSETLGSISSPSARTGVTGLRPSYGRVPRTGAMALSWSMDKLGPMCRSVEDCALVLQAIAGPDGRDGSAAPDTFAWSSDRRVAGRRVGYLRSAFERSGTDSPTRAFDLAALEVLDSLQIELVPVELPDFPYEAMTIILNAEAAAAFDELTRGDLDDAMVRQERNAWPNVFRAARTIPAVEYINANRVRTLAIRAWAALFDGLDAIVTPTNAPGQLTASNLTGHPAVILPNGFHSNGTPVSLTFLGGLYREPALLTVAHGYQQATDFHRRHPDFDGGGGA